MRRYLLVTVLALTTVLAAASVLTGCARPGRSSSPGQPGLPDQPSRRPNSAGFPARAEQVAAAWKAALAGAGGDAWQHGFVPLQELTVPPASGFTAATKVAYTSGWYVSRIPLPGGTGTGTVRFHNGGSLAVPLVTAGEALRALRHGDPPCAGGVDDCARLTVTGVELGTVTMRTSRGDAQVPAWLFHLAELPEPVARVAVRVDPRTLALAAPAVPAPDTASIADLRQVIGLAGVAGDRLRLTIGVGACDRNPAGLVYQTPGEVVVAGTAIAGTGPCTLQLLGRPVSVRLARPLGERVVLDALSGRPLVEGVVTPQPGGR